MSRRYEYRQVVEHTEVAPNLVRRWIDAGIIRPAVPAEGAGSRRLFSLRHLVLVRILDWLHRLGLGESEMRRVASAVELSWASWSVATTKELNKNFLWIRMSPHAARRHDARLEATSLRAAPIISLADRGEITSGLIDGNVGIVVPLAPIIKELEAKTGETLS